MRTHRTFDEATEGRVTISAPLPFDYKQRRASSTSPRELIVLLHGYAESGARILDKLLPALPDDALIVSPNATFPMATRTASGYTMVFAWYFYDTTKKEYVIDMTAAQTHLSQGLSQLGYSKLPKRIIGFSQGGYLAPFVAQTLGNVTQFVGIACEYLYEELSSLGDKISYRVDGIHGAKDDVVPLTEALSTHDGLRALGVEGTLHVLPETGHRIDAAVVEKLREILARS